jgi:hypothetical protein
VQWFRHGSIRASLRRIIREILDKQMARKLAQTANTDSLVIDYSQIRYTISLFSLPNRASVYLNNGGPGSALWQQRKAG